MGAGRKKCRDLVVRAAGLAIRIRVSLSIDMSLRAVVRSVDFAAHTNTQYSNHTKHTYYVVCLFCGVTHLSTVAHVRARVRVLLRASAVPSES